MSVQLHRFAILNDESALVWQAPFGSTVKVQADACHIELASIKQSVGNAPFVDQCNALQHVQFLRLGHQKPFHEDTLFDLVEKQKSFWGITQGTSFITAASMASLRVGWCFFNTPGCAHQHWVAVYLTAGLANALRAGDKASVVLDHQIHVDTINIVLETSLTLSDTAAIEALCIAVEAKCTVMQELNIKSKVSDKIATGTGTDAILIASSTPQANPTRYAGKHTVLGEIIGTTVYETLIDSLSFYEK